jgi:hypothetical protein
VRAPEWVGVWAGLAGRAAWAALLEDAVVPRLRLALAAAPVAPELHDVGPLRWASAWAREDALGLERVAALLAADMLRRWSRTLCEALLASADAQRRADAAQWYLLWRDALPRGLRAQPPVRRCFAYALWALAQSQICAVRGHSFTRRSMDDAPALHDATLLLPPTPSASAPAPAPPHAHAPRTAAASSLLLAIQAERRRDGAAAAAASARDVLEDVAARAGALLEPLPHAPLGHAAADAPPRALFRILRAGRAPLLVFLHRDVVFQHLPDGRAAPLGVAGLERLLDS